MKTFTFVVTDPKTVAYITEIGGKVVDNPRGHEVSIPKDKIGGFRISKVTDYNAPTVISAKSIVTDQEHQDMVVWCC